LENGEKYGNSFDISPKMNLLDDTFPMNYHMPKIEICSSCMILFDFRGDYHWYWRCFPTRWIVSVLMDIDSSGREWCRKEKLLADRHPPYGG
jgi:hypothetical protein